MMELIQKVLGWLRHPETLIDPEYPYAILALVIFLETGALVFFLPGDSLLVTAGLYASQGKFLNIALLNVILIPCAIVGDAVSYFIGSRSGAALFNKEESRFFKPKYLKLAQAFYERHGGKAIIIARFMPLVRTFVPVVAGIARMPYRRFASFNVIGGAAWVFSMTMIGYLLGNIFPDAGRHIEKLIILVVFLSILPGIIGWIRSRNSKTPAEKAEA